MAKTCVNNYKKQLDSRVTKNETDKKFYVMTLNIVPLLSRKCQTISFSDKNNISFLGLLILSLSYSFHLSIVDRRYHIDIPNCE